MVPLKQSTALDQERTLSALLPRGEYRNVFDVETIVVEPSRELLTEMSQMYGASLVENPCTDCAARGGVQYCRDVGWLEESMRIKGSTLLIARNIEGLQGFAHFYCGCDSLPPFAQELGSRWSFSPQIAYMYLILSKASMRGRGIGTSMYLAACEEASRRGCKLMVAEIYVCPVPNSASLRFHERLGFSYTGRAIERSRLVQDRAIKVMYTEMVRPIEPQQKIKELT